MPRSPDATVDTLVADLSSLAETKRLAEQVRERYPRLDVLLNNAGAMFWNRSESADGIEKTFALNHLSYFVLTNLLLPVLEQSAPARIVNVASDAHKGVSINFDDIQFKQKYSGWKAYQQSKLANILFTYELARRMEGTGVTANTLHPGFVQHQLSRSLQGCARGLADQEARAARGSFAGAGGTHVDLPGFLARGRGDLGPIFRQGKARRQLTAVARPGERGTVSLADSRPNDRSGRSMSDVSSARRDLRAGIPSVRGHTAPRRKPGSLAASRYQLKTSVWASD